MSASPLPSECLADLQLELSRTQADLEMSRANFQSVSETAERQGLSVAKLRQNYQVIP